MHPFTVGRLLLWFALGSLGFREGYEDLTTWNTIERKYKPVPGRYRWLSIGILCTEMICNWKYKENTGHLILDAPTPFLAWFPWFIFYGSMFVFWIYLRFKEGHTIKYPLDEKAPKSKRVKGE